MVTGTPQADTREKAMAIRWSSYVSIATFGLICWQEAGEHRHTSRFNSRRRQVGQRLYGQERHAMGGNYARELLL
jgi:hypothetical protein